MPSDRLSDRQYLLLAGAGLAFYVLFTLLPNSNSLMVKWPWVLGWQLGLALGPVTLIAQTWRQKSLICLGNKLDWLIGGWLLCLGLNVLFASFVHQAGWYAWAAVCAIATLYALIQWLTSFTRISHLLHFQGVLVIGFALLSLTLWSLQTALPYLDTLESLKSYGISKSFDWQIVSLRNWYPIGHQNYVAGYLVLSLPLLLGLSVLHKGWRRILWGAGFLVSLVCLYTTASRGSWFGLFASAVAFGSLSAWRYPNSRRRLGFAAAVCAGGLMLWGLGSDRLKPLILSAVTGSAFTGDSSELAYRVITNTTGWLIGADHWLFGAGLGSVALLYQKYLPFWAGQSAELTYQLHSTPAQIWAELGLVGSLLALASGSLLIWLVARWFLSGNYQREGFLMVASLCSGLLGYGTFSLTDYQLDNLCISGSIIIFLSVLTFHLKEHKNAYLPTPISPNPPPPNPSSLVKSGLLSPRERAGVRAPHSFTIKRFPFAVSGAVLLAIASFWLYPIHRAWMLSSQGFAKLAQKDVAGFVNKLESAHRLAPWEPYYSYQLGWNLGELAYLTLDAQQRDTLRSLSTQWFETANATSPYQEFGYSNLGWLLVNAQPAKAVTAFSQAAQLVPNKKGSFFALGYGLLQANKPDLAVQAVTLELLRNPLLLTSPIWQSEELRAVFPKVLSAFEQACTEFTAEAPPKLEPYFHQLRGALHWWRGDFEAAQADFNHVPGAFNRLMLSLATRAPVDLTEQASSPAEVAAVGWLNADQREATFYKALLLFNPSEYAYPESYLAQMNQEIVQSAARSDSFHQWLTQMAPSRSQRNQRLGFGVISRHIDGPLPSDFSPRVENVLMTQFFGDLFPAVVYAPDLDRLLEPLREQLLTQLSGS